MAISASSIASSATLNQLRTQFNNLVTDVTALEGGSISYTTLNSTTLNSTTVNVKEDGTIIFEGATDDGFETTLTVVDPTADRTITFPNETGTVHTTGGDTTHTNIIIADGGNIGSASDTNAIGISSGGVVSITATTANTSATDGALTVGGGLGVAADASIGDDLRLISDSAVLSFGADSDTTLTHTDGSGLTLNSTNKLMFNDASQFIQGASATVLDIAATDEIELTATLIDVVGNLAASGTYTGGGLMTTGGNIVIPNAGNIGSVGDTDAIAIASGGGVTLSQTLSGAAGTFSGILKTDDTTEATSTTDGSLQTDGGLSVAKDVVAGDDVKLLSDAAVLAFGADGDVTLTHVADTGLLLNGTSQLQFNDASQNITAPSGTVLDINATDEVELNATLVDVNANLDVSGTYTGGGLMTTGGNIVIPDAGTIGSASDTDAISISSGGVVNVSATTANTSASDGALTVAGGLGVAADASIGDDLRLISDSAVLSFGADSEVTLTHVADTGLTLTHTASGDDKPIVLNLKSEEDAIIADEEIGRIDFTAGDSDGTDAILTAASIAAVAEDTFAADNNSTGLAFKLGVSAAATEMFRMDHDGDFKIKTDGSAIGFGANNEIELTHVHDTGLLLTDSGGTPTLQLHDSNESIASDGSKVIITSGGTAFNLPTSDGSDGHFLKTDGGGNLTFAAASSSSLAADDLSAGDAAINLTTTSGNITIDAAANDSDIIFKGTDGSSDTTFLTIDGSDAGTLIANHNLELGTDASEILFGADNEIKMIHVADTGLNLKHTATTDDTPFVLTLQTGDTDIAANDVIGKLAFQAPDEGTGTDAILVAAAIQAVSEGDFAADANATRLEFMTGASEAATSKMTLSSGGVLDVDGGVTIDNITIDGTEIDLSSGDLTLDVAGDIVLDAGGDEVIYKDGSTNVGHVSMDSDNLTIKSLVSDKDMIFQGNDGGTGITALTLDMSEAGAATFNNDVTAFSDERLKTEIETINDALNKVCQMRGVSFKRTDNDGRTSVGVIAQEIEKILPEVVREDKTEDKIKSVAYGNIVGVLIEAIKELKNEIEELKKE